MFNRDELIQVASDGYNNDGFFNQIEFKKDLYNLLIIKKMIKRFLTKGEINDKLLINNIIISINVFGIEKVNILFSMLLYENEIEVLSPILTFLGCNRLDQQVNDNPIIEGILNDTATRYNIPK